MKSHCFCQCDLQLHSEPLLLTCNGQVMNSLIRILKRYTCINNSLWPDLRGIQVATDLLTALSRYKYKDEAKNKFWYFNNNFGINLAIIFNTNGSQLAKFGSRFYGKLTCFCQAICRAEAVCMSFSKYC